MRFRCLLLPGLVVSLLGCSDAPAGELSSEAIERATTERSTEPEPTGHTLGTDTIVEVDEAEPEPQPEEQEEPEVSVTGTVVSAVTGDPLADVTVHTATAEAITDTEGSFTLTGGNDDPIVAERPAWQPVEIEPAADG